MNSHQMIAVFGISGKMGQEISKQLSEKKIQYFGISKSGKGEDLKNVYKLKSAPISKAAVILDFSISTAFDDILAVAIKEKKPLVSGTTGLSDLQIKKAKAASKKIPILWAPNMSLGVAVLKKAIRIFSNLKGFDFQIEEYHHHQKKDSPSGTGIMLQETLKKSVKKNIPEILSIRAGGIVGTHKVHAISKNEHLIFEHSALNRSVFASGALRSALWIQEKPPGFYSIEDVLDEE